MPWCPLHQSANPFLQKIFSKIAFFGGPNPVFSLAELLCDSMLLLLTFDMLPPEK
jgi:hypothetical protein